MVYVREGYPHGAWVITVDGKRVVQQGGEHSFPMLDSLYEPKHANPRQWEDYTRDLVPDAQSRLLSMLT